MFSCDICEIFKSTYFKGHLRTTASETGGMTFIPQTYYLVVIDIGNSLAKDYISFQKSCLTINIYNNFE